MMTWDSYVAGWRELHGGYDPSAGSRVVRGWLRLAYLMGRCAARTGVTPGMVTGIGVVLSAGVPATVWTTRGGPFLGAVLVLSSAVADTVDGAVAVITGRASRIGQVYDALADRIGEVCWLVGLGLLGAPAWLLVVCGGLSWLHEYLRARAAVAGMNGIAVVTVAERPTRVILVVAGLVVAGVAGLVPERLVPAGVVPAGLVSAGFVPADPRALAVTAVAGVWVALAAIGFGQLFRTVRSVLR
jgi:CDP-diacylglycerol--glycerol-3-phosphate 3-phosphatidyltransferase